MPAIGRREQGEQTSVQHMPAWPPKVTEISEIGQIAIADKSDFD
jgi:hypothetical protein